MVLRQRCALNSTSGPSSVGRMEWRTKYSIVDVNKNK